jgi:hypothetical protein
MLTKAGEHSPTTRGFADATPIDTMARPVHNGWNGYPSLAHAFLFRA